MCSNELAACCTVTSTFAILFLFAMGLLVRAQYPYIGEWADPLSPLSEEDQAGAISMTCFYTAGVYAVFLVASLVSCAINAGKARFRAAS